MSDTRAVIRKHMPAGIVISGLRPSALTGAASLCDFTGVLAPRVRIARPQTAAGGLAKDWQCVGRSLWSALPSEVTVEALPEARTKSG